MLTLLTKGGKGVSHFLTIAEKAGREDPDPPDIMYEQSLR